LAFFPAGLWNPHLALRSSPLALGPDNPPTQFQVDPHYRNERPLDQTLHRVCPEFDRFPEEIYADQIGRILEDWSASFVRSPRKLDWFAKYLAADFSGVPPQAVDSRLVRSSLGIEVRRNRFEEHVSLSSSAFVKVFESSLQTLTNIDVAEFQITHTKVSGGTAENPPSQLETRIRYEIVGAGTGFYREQRIGDWQLIWRLAGRGDFKVAQWQLFDETQARSLSPVYADVAAPAFGGNNAYSAQMLHGVDYWRTVLDGACGIDIYGHNGISAADIDNDGFDDLYVCQPAGLPNRLFRNRGDGTFEDITDRYGLGILENTACALFADFDNDGRQDVIVVRANGPLLFLNQGDGRFLLQPEAFKFANPPQGTFTGAAVADYNRDGWLDIYFCLYSFYQGTGQYKYPSPYHDAKNGPPNFLMRNNRDGTFLDVTAQSGLDKNNTRYSFCCAWGDSNNDGWPDLYVVNDFGRKNLYHNNGDGTFTDVAPKLDVEDVGAGMSVSWFDSDNNGSPDLYVANMWTAAGIRVSMLDAFKKDSAPNVRALYQKHAMGNSLLRNRGAKFEDSTQISGTGMGRWAWTSDAFDFDHDGYNDIYVLNGMVSGPKRYDLNSFFWRQVVAYSPDQAGSSRDYEQGWNAINELIRSDQSWSGYERNVFYANNRDGTFSDLSAVIGVDFREDGRSFALADFDHDGRQEILLKNRNAPQLRLLKNALKGLPPAISFRLKGTKSNRDAIGARVTIQTSSGRQTKMLQAGSGFLCQHSKDVFFGLGEATGPIQASIQWPSGLVQAFHNLPANHRIWVEEGSVSTRMEAFKKWPGVTSPAAQRSESPESLPTEVETWLLSPVPAADFSLTDLSGKSQSLFGQKGKCVLLNFWTSQSAGCPQNLALLEKNHTRWSDQGLRTFSVHLDEVSNDGKQISSANELDKFVRSHSFEMPIVRGSAEVAAIYNILFRQIYDRHRDMPLPTSFLIDSAGMIVKIYQGTIPPEHVDQDFAHFPGTDAERLLKALPFPGTKPALDFGRNQLSLGALFFQRGYLDQAESSFQQALRDDSSSAEALYGIASVYLNQNKNAAAREMFQRCVQLKPNYPETLPDAWNNLGVLATREDHIDEAITLFQRALRINPDHLLSLDNLGNAYRAQTRWEDARHVLERAVSVAPDDPEANYSLGMVFAQTKATDKAEEYLQRALKVRPAYPEALNNLGILYLVTNRREQAVASFEKCIQTAPTFDQAYLNLARVYAIEGERDKARAVLLVLMKQHPNHPQAEQMLDQLQH
jgi:tetratricopeptide (TPR) repeat protein/peroxiredoxin